MQLREQEASRHIGRRLRELRIARGIGLVELGEVIGISYQGFQKYESGECMITAPRLMAIAEKLGVPIGYFFDTRDANTVDEDMQIAILRLARKLKQIERRRPERYRRLRDSINALAKGME